MNSKDFLWDFISFVLGVIGVLFVVFYIILGDNYEFFARLALFIMFPLVLCASILVIKTRIRRREHRRRQDEGNTDITVTVPFGYRMLSDIFLYATPLLVLVSALIIKGMPEADDLVQAAMVWLVFYGWQRLIWSRQER